MNRERAETYLRLLAEAETREPRTWLFPLAWAAHLPAGITCQKMQTVAQALIAVGALDAETAEAILADFDIAVGARQLHRGRTWPEHGISVPATQAGRRIQFTRPWPRAAGPPPQPARASSRPPLARSPAGAEGSPTTEGAPGPERFVPLGLTIPFQHWGSCEGLYLMSYAHTADGARFLVASRAHGRVNLNMTALASCAVTDDRGGRYQLHFTGTSSGPEWTAVMSLAPDPPGDLRWLDFCPPRGTAVRVGLDSSPSPGAAGSEGAAAEVSQAELGPGEHLLTLIAERLLYELRLSPRGFRQLATEAPGPFGNLAAGLGTVVAALEAAEVLPPDSPWLGRLVTLCANLDISDPELTAPPLPDLPEQWLSLLAHYLRRKADAAPNRDGVAAALAGPLPEVDGIRLALLGVHNAESTSFVHVLASGLPWDSRNGPFGVDMYFPLSVWIRDDGGRWHLARPDGLHRVGGEDILRLRLAPPLTRSTAWIEVLVAGRSARVRARLPFRWENLL